MTSRGSEDFGAYLATVQERDIDLLLMEKFHVGPSFASWFAARCGVSSATFDGAWHSVTDADGETDLLLRVAAGTEHVGILIENKVAAPQQQRQAERYHLRATRAQNAGKFDKFVVCLAAPAIYLAALPDDGGYDVTLAYEQVAGWYLNIADDARAAWRHRVVCEAIEQGRRGYTMVLNEAVTRFHQDFWEYLQHFEPNLTMRRPTPKGSGSSWVRFKGVGFGPKLEFACKLDQQIVELSFLGRHVDELRARRAEWPKDVVISQKGKTAALHLATPRLDKARPLGDQADALAVVMAQTKRLLPFASLLD